MSFKIPSSLSGIFLPKERQFLKVRLVIEFTIY